MAQMKLMNTSPFKVQDKWGHDLFSVWFALWHLPFLNASYLTSVFFTSVSCVTHRSYSCHSAHIHLIHNKMITWLACDNANITGQIEHSEIMSHAKCMRVSNFAMTDRFLALYHHQRQQQC